MHRTAQTSSETDAFQRRRYRPSPDLQPLPPLTKQPPPPPPIINCDGSATVKKSLPLKNPSFFLSLLFLSTCFPWSRAVCSVVSSISFN